MDASSPHQTPDPLYGIQLWTIRRQKIECKALSMSGSPLLMHLGMMISGIIRDYQYSTSRFAAVQSKVLEEPQERLGIKTSFLSLEKEFTIAQAHRREVANATVGRMMQDYRIASFWRYPHTAARTMLLKTDFIHSP
jgi:hypothetical protein